MDTDKTTEGDVDTRTNEGEGSEVETISIPKTDYEKLNQTLGSYKRQIKDLTKSKDESRETKETPQNQPNQNALLQKSFLRSAGITKEKEVELALATAKKWGVEVDALVDDEDFRVKLEKLRTTEANTLATSDIKGGQGNSQAKNTVEHWVALGKPPTATEVPDRKMRAKILRGFMAGSESGKKFYND